MLDITAITDALTPNGEPVQYRVAPELLAGDPLRRSRRFTAVRPLLDRHLGKHAGLLAVARTEAEYCEIAEARR